MLRKNLDVPAINPPKGCRIAVVASQYNAEYVDSMLEGALSTLSPFDQLEVLTIRVPGAFEIPVVVSELLGGETDSEAVICLGVVLRGKTTHAQHITESVTDALMQLQVDYRTPVVHEVLLLEDRQQASERCLDPEHNRGVEAAQTALRMVSVLHQLRM